MLFIVLLVVVVVSYALFVRFINETFGKQEVWLTSSSDDGMQTIELVKDGTSVGLFGPKKLIIYADGKKVQNRDI